MLPITILPTVIIDHVDWYQVKTRAKQPKPYNLPSPYSVRNRVQLVKTNTYATRRASMNVYVENLPELATPTSESRNRAYAKFVEQLGEASQLGATLTAERRESFGLITMFVTKALRATVMAKRGDVLGLLSTLGAKFPEKVIRRTVKIRGKRRRISGRFLTMPDGRLVSKSSANAWLLWSYGVSPLLDDVQTSTDAFLRSIPVSLKINVASRVLIDKVTILNDTAALYKSRTVSGYVRTGYSATVSVANPDLYLANQLGLVNPAQWVNEAIPFSFVIDWASNWSQVISSLTDFAGLDISNQCVSTKRQILESYYDRARQLDGKTYKLSNLSVQNSLFTRVLTAIPKPTLLFKYERFEWRRGLNAISLLVGMLPNGKR